MRLLVFMFSVDILIISWCCIPTCSDFYLFSVIKMESKGNTFSWFCIGKDYYKFTIYYPYISILISFSSEVQSFWIWSLVRSWPLFWALFISFLLGTAYSINVRSLAEKKCIPLMQWRFDDRIVLWNSISDHGLSKAWRIRWILNYPISLLAAPSNKG